MQPLRARRHTQQAAFLGASSTSPSTKRSTCGRTSAPSGCPFEASASKHQRERLASNSWTMLSRSSPDAPTARGAAPRSGCRRRETRRPPGACAAARLRCCRAPRRASTARTSGVSARRRRARRSRASGRRSAPAGGGTTDRWYAARRPIWNAKRSSHAESSGVGSARGASAQSLRVSNSISENERPKRPALRIFVAARHPRKNA